MALIDNLRELEALRRTLAATAERRTFGREVREARKKRGMTLEALASATGIAKSYLSQIETGYASPPREDKVRKIAKALGLDAGALVARAHLSQLPADLRERMARLKDIFDSTEGVIRALLVAKGEGSPDTAVSPEGRAMPKGPPPDQGETTLDLDALHKSGLLHHLAEWGASRAGADRQAVRPVPVINKVAAGYPEDFTDLGYPVGIADEYVAGPAELSDPNAFALRVVGDSMEPRYHEGDVVIFSPAAPVDSGADCFVRFATAARPSDGESTFKRVFFDAPDRVRLQPLNERYAPTFVKPAEIEGIFRAVARYERL
jgi:phage repressor protein C with HTH and peptisase S24 domain/transcriptional regulator with XRE-family HTH domain